jgi:TP901 family phage tail tape measure protein
MAITERALTIIEVDGKQAQDKLKALSVQLEQLTAEKKKLSKEPLTDPKLLKQVDREIAQTRKEMTAYKKELVDVRKVMNNLSGSSLKQLEAAYRRVAAERKGMTRGTKDYAAMVAAEKKLKSEIDKANNSLRARQPLLNRVADSFSKFGGIVMAAAASFAGVIFSVKQAINAYLELDEKMTDVMKTTGLTKEQVEKLNAELTKIDTRTSQQELLDLARVAGKLGITAENDIIAFVKASDQIAVALSEDLGGNVEESVNQIGKLVDIFGIKEEFGIEQSLLKIGSTINSLGAIGTANEGYMVEFAKRVGGVAPMAGISIDKVMGLGAVLDELGQTAEISGTTLSQVIGAMFKDTAKFADVANMSVEDFTNLLNTDANEAFIKLLIGAKGTSGGFAELANNLDGLGLDGARSIGVLGVLANNIDLVRERQAYANEEFVKGTSLTEEFNTKNSSATAQLEKAKKAFTAVSVELGKKLQPAMAGIVSKAGLLLKTISSAIDLFIKYKGVIIPATLALVTYWTAQKLAAYWTAISSAAQKVAAAATFIYRNAVSVLTGQLNLATVAQKAFSTASKANIWGAIAAAIMAAVAAITIYVKNSNKLSKVTESINSTLAHSTAEFNALKEAMLAAEPGTAERARLIQLMNEKYGEYLPALVSEGDSYDQIQAKLLGVNEQLERKALLELRDSMSAEKMESLGKSKIELRKAKEQQTTYQKRYWDPNEQDRIYVADALYKANQNVTRLENEVKTKQAELDEILRLIDAEIASIKVTTTPPKDNGPKEGDEKDIDGVTYVFKGGKWVAKKVKPDYTPTVSKDSGKSSYTEGDNLKYKNEADFETAQLARAMLDEEGRYYEKYLDNRKSATETYVGWKADFDQLSFDEELALIKQHSADYLQQLEFLYASGAITDQQYTEAKFAEEGRALTQQRDLLLEHQMNVAEIETQIGDWEIEYERYKQSELLRIQQEALEQKEKKRKAYGETVKFIESGLVSVIQNLEEYELTKAGENEEKKKAIKKKYANIDFMIALAQIASSQAQGTMAAWASAMQLGYPAGPIVGGIMTGVLAAIGVTETMIALAQRNAVMSLATGGFAGYTGPGAKYEKKQLVQLHGNEYVIPSEGMNNPYVAGVVGAIEYARQTKTLRSLNFAAANRSMASGGYVSSSSGSKVSASTSVSFPAEFYSVISGLAATQQALNAKLDNLKANISFDKIQIADQKISAAQSKSSR